ncbi:methylated-DNA--[protein]-cysteine S-methyltransferase [Mycobacterium cookii]|uniref:Methylated-DNA--protein-cysteine methyltransferase n=1 Tax=Mycobacterium cookii TaxID=1775 RepID=A0A7I7KYW9_9MYCO|nr:methylated-DNA--[protein]-cysteine S-methyltransferase [Mycobacterium cookii]MCV7330882.1 methylated-DNA--[protein]-cysteine S-methyltransferase [Mycobacterium cookii]BBX46522.1 methylated-DNA--protein-cysteine methyltransferase [Mycobacterium cookii]
MSTATTTTRHAVIDSPIGPLTLVREDDGLTGLYYPGHWTHPDQTTFGPRVDATADPEFDDAVTQLNEYFAGERKDFDLPLNPQGSDRAQRVWRLLAEIPYGQTTTYGALARAVGEGISPRAIGGFVGHNPLSIYIACHRVVGSTGKLTGYAGGLDRKQYLLELEKAIPVAPQSLW